MFTKHEIVSKKNYKNNSQRILNTLPKNLKSKKSKDFSELR